MTDLHDKVVLITGAGKGNGRLLAHVLAEHGAIIAANDISPMNVDELVDQIQADGGRAKAYVDDVAKKLGVQSIVKQVEDDFGRIDILINHAAVEPQVPLLDFDEWDWHRVLDVNLTGTFLMTQSVGRIMRAQGSGVIINLISEPASGASFAASMSGLEGLTRQAMLELNPYGIRVYAVQNMKHQTVERVLEILAREKDQP